MAMSRSLGGRSFTRRSPMWTSPDVISSRPATIRRVVDFPHPDGPTRTMNSLSRMWRFTSLTAYTSSNFLFRSFNTTCAIVKPPGRVGDSGLGASGCQPRNVVIHQECVEQDRGEAREERPGHQPAPVVHVAFDQRRHGADRQQLFLVREDERHRVEKSGPGDRKGEHRGGDETRHRDGEENPEQHLEVVGAVHQRGLVQLAGDGGEIPDEDPRAERDDGGGEHEQQGPLRVQQAQPADDLEERDEEKGIGHEVRQKHAGAQDAGSDEAEPRQAVRREDADHQREDRHQSGDDGRVLEVDEEISLREQVLVMLEGRALLDEERDPLQALDLLVGLERGQRHPVGREQEKHHEHGDHAVADDEHGLAAGLDRPDHTTLRRTPRRIKKADTARIGNITSATAAPRGTSPDSMPRRNENVPKRWVSLRGPPRVRTRTMSKLAKVTMVEKSIVIAMMFFSMGRVMKRSRWKGPAPSMEAESNSSSGIDFRPARYMIMKKGVPYQTLTRMMEKRAQKGSASQDFGAKPSSTRIQFRALWVGSKIHHQPRVESARGITQGTRETPRQTRWPRVGSVLITRARIKPSSALKKTAVKVKRKEVRTTSQNVSIVRRKRKLSSQTTWVSRLFSIAR